MSMNKGKVIFIDDEKHVRRSRRQTLKLAGYEVMDFSRAEDALPHLQPEWPGVVVSDIKMTGLDGMELLERVVTLDKDLPVVLMTGHGDVPMAVKAMHIGAYDFIEKPCPTEHFLDILNRAMEKRKLIIENRTLRSEIAFQNQNKSQIIGKSPAIERLNEILVNIAESDADILIVGETGTGKELLARTLHDLSTRAGETFVAVNCGAIPETLIESELFGHEAGAFTGAHQRRIGKFEFGNKGTIFLDEIESMPLQLQVRLLRVLQERTVERLGTNESIPVNVRIIAAAKTDLKEASLRNEFREDLFYRLNVVNIELPPLHDRREDIPYLFQHFVVEASQRYKYDPPPIPRSTIQELMVRAWEGNIRELKNEAERFVLGFNLGNGQPVTLPDSKSEFETNANVNLANLVSTFEKTTIEQELIRQKGDIKKTYTSLGIPRQTLYDKMNKYGLKRSEFT